MSAGERDTCIWSIAGPNVCHHRPRVGGALERGKDNFHSCSYRLQTVD
jgi:hypothetical protein